MSSIVREAIIEYERQRLNNPYLANPSSLKRYLNEIKRELKKTDMNTDSVHDAFGLYFLLQDREATLNLLQCYLTRPLPIVEQAWARWNLVDTLALMRRCDELVPTHKDFLEWAQRELEPDRLFWVMEDGTQALGWFHGGHGADWMKIFWELNHTIPISKHNRIHRFQHHRSACYALSRYGQPEEALAIADRLLHISHEDPSWEYAFLVEMAAHTASVEAYACLGDIENLRSITENAYACIEQYAISLPEPDSLGEIHPPLPEQLHPADCLGRYYTELPQREPVFSFRAVCHNLAAVLYRAKQYGLAIPLFERAMEYKSLSRYLAHCYAGSVWVVTQDKEKVLSFLKKVAPIFGDKNQFWKDIPELEDLIHDSEFQRAL